VIDPNITCGLCRYCRLGLSNMCEKMTTLGIFRHGGMAEYNLAPAQSLHKISSDVPVERATLAEPLACVLHAFEKSQPLPGESVVIVGAGPIGLMFLMLYKTAGVGKVFVIEPREFRRRAAAGLGADFTLDPTSDDCAVEIEAATDVGADLVVDAAGTMLPAALKFVRRGGRVVLFGMNLHAVGEINQYYVTRHEVSILGSFIQRTSFPKAVRILESGVLPLEKLVTHKLRLQETGKAWEAMHGGEAIKAVIEP
jgi:threonine dehydrogenase-like Zn-dependent dehydrogenase